ncbi:MAG: DotU family type IV/VI secretion system protein [Phycisphaerales bacterium]
MTLTEICEPLFQYICRLNRLGRKGGRTDQGLVKSEIKGIFADMRSRAEATPGMVGPYDQIEKVLMFYTDSMILNSQNSFPGGWKPFSADPRQLGINEGAELAFEEKFWDLLEETLRDPTEGATAKLGVFYSCIGLGFTGLYDGQPEYRRKKMLELSARLRGQIDVDQAARICPPAYEGVDTRNLTITPVRKLTGVVIALGVLTVVVFVGYVYSFRTAHDALKSNLTNISNTRTAGVGSSPEGSK